MGAKRIRKRTVVTTIFVAIVLGFGCRLVLAYARFAKVEDNFASIGLGQSKSVVIARLGKPHYYSGPCGIIHNPQPGCSSEYIYGYPLAPLNPDYYIVAFSADGRVIEADQWTSP